MEWLTKAWGKFLRTLVSKRITPKQTTCAFLYSRDRLCAGLCVGDSSFSRETEASLKVNIGISLKLSRSFWSWSPVHLLSFVQGGLVSNTVQIAVKCNSSAPVGFFGCFSSFFWFDCYFLHSHYILNAKIKQYSKRCWVCRHYFF